MGKILGVDFGDKRTGLAASDVSGFLASPIGTIEESAMKKVAEKVSQKALELKAEKIIIGFPKNMNNTLGERAEKTKKFSELVIGLCGIEVVLWDERNTTVSAHKIFNEVNIRGEKRKKSVDTLSATILLQSYLDKAK